MSKLSDSTKASSVSIEAAVFDAVDSLRDDMASVMSELISIASVNPKYPGQTYDSVVGLEGRVSETLAEIYQEGGAELSAGQSSRGGRMPSARCPASVGAGR